VSGSKKDIFDIRISALTYVLVNFSPLEFYSEAGQTYIVSVSLSAEQG